MTWANRTTTRLVAQLLIVALMTICGCSFTPDHPFWIKTSVRDAAPAARLLLAPANALDDLPKELAPGRNRVQIALEHYINSTSSKVIGVLSRDVFQNVVRETGFKLGAEQASPMLERLANQYSFDALVIPSIVIRKIPVGRSGGAGISWDGVWRTSGLPSDHETWGKTSVASLSIEIYTPDGDRVFHGLGGLDMLFVANLKDKKMELVQEPLSNEAHLREGAALALDP